MTPDEIRKSLRHDANGSETEYLPCVIVYALAEIAAQLSELNQNIRFMSIPEHEKTLLREVMRGGSL